MDSFRPGLENEQLARVTVLGPFDIHWSSLTSSFGIVLFNQTSPTSELQHFIITQTTSLSLCFNNFADARTFAIETVNHFYFFAADVSADNWSSAFFQCWF